MDERTIKQACDEALQIKSQGYNCAQAVVGALAPFVALDPENAYKMMAGFGGGMRHKQLCGAVLAAGLILGMRFGSSRPDKEADECVKDVILKLVGRFQEKHRTTVCKEILENDTGAFIWDIDDPGKKISDYHLKAPVCGAAITDAVAITLELIEGGC